MLVFISIIRCINYSNRAVLISRSSTLWCRMLGSVQTLYVGTQCYGCYYCTPFLYVEYLIVQITLIQPFSIWVILWYRQAMEILGFLGSVHIKGQLFTTLLFFFRNGNQKEIRFPFWKIGGRLASGIHLFREERNPHRAFRFSTLIFTVEPQLFNRSACILGTSLLLKLYSAVNPTLQCYYI